MDLEECARQLMEGRQGDALKKLTESEAGAKLAARFDGAEVERAARAGDSASLSKLLGAVLSTPEGRAFAEQVRKAVDQGGR